MSVPAVNVTVNTLDATAAVAAGVAPKPLKPETMLLEPAAAENPVIVTTSLLNELTFVGFMVTVMKPVEVGAVLTLEMVTKGVTATSVPEAVVSKALPAAIVAAAMVFDAAITPPGLMMLVTEKDACVPAVRVPAEKVTVNTPPVRVGAAVAAPLAMPVISPTAMVAVEVKPVSVTTTLLKPVTADGVNVMVAFPVDPAIAFAKVTAKLGVICTSVPVIVVSRVADADIVAAAMVIELA